MAKDWKAYRVKYNASRVKEAKDRGYCSVCWKVPAQDGATRCSKCAEKNNKRQNGKRWERKANGLCHSHPRIKAEPGKTYCRACLDEQNARSKARWENPSSREKIKDSIEKLRLAALFAYGGPVCVCCGETERVFLTLDHINNDGGEHRRSIGMRSGGTFYRYLRDNDYPKGLQVLCWNCNSAKRIVGECPHQKQHRDIKKQARRSQGS